MYDKRSKYCYMLDIKPQMLFSKHGVHSVDIVVSVNGHTCNVYHEFLKAAAKRPLTFGVYRPVLVRPNVTDQGE